jgi:pectate lyase
LFALAAAALAARVSSSAERSGPLPAFPGAEGFGATTPGGRGGRVIKVTNLNRSGPGSLQAAVEARGARIVVFDVGGVIRGDVKIVHGRITIAGQTAPDPGITIRGMIMKSWDARGSLDDVVLRFLRVRPPGGRGNQGDAIQVSGNRLVIDQCSCSWAEDETIDVYAGRDVTVQWCTIEESDTGGHPKGRHNYGMINGPRGGRITVHHNLFAHHARRNPAIGVGPADVRNNVIYNFHQGLSHEGHAPNGRWYNVVANYYKKGPSNPRIFIVTTLADRKYYIVENFIEGIGVVRDPRDRSQRFPRWIQLNHLGGVLTEPVDVPAVRTHTARQAYRLVLERAGCFPRDVVTVRCVENTKKGTGSWGRKEPGDLLEGLPPRARARPDADGDGMPDAWEAAHGSNPRLDDHNRTLPSGYTLLEEYCNQMAAWRIAGSPPRECPGDGSVAFSRLVRKRKPKPKRASSAR